MSAQQTEAVNVLPYPEVSRKSIEHLKTYSLVKAARNWFYYIPFTKQTKEVLTPTVKIIRNTQPIKIVFDYGDVAVDSLLVEFDGMVTNVQSIDAKDVYASVARPVKGCIDTVDKSVKSTDQKLRQQIVEPTMKTMNNVIEKISKPIIDEVKNSLDHKETKSQGQQTLDAFNKLQSPPDKKISLKQSVSAAISSISAKSKNE